MSSPGEQNMCPEHVPGPFSAKPLAPQIVADPVSAYAQIFPDTRAGHVYDFALILVTLLSTQILGNTLICLNTSIFIAASRSGA